MGPVSGAGGAVGGSPGVAAPGAASSSFGNGAPSTGPTMFPGSPAPSPSLGLTARPSATAGTAASSNGATIGIGGATVGGPTVGGVATSGSGSTNGGTPGATMDAGANPGLYGVAPGANAGAAR
jgi:hypothetical protein